MFFAVPVQFSKQGGDGLLEFRNTFNALEYSTTGEASSMCRMQVECPTAIIIAAILEAVACDPPSRKARHSIREKM